jgi:Fic family protein
MAVYTHQLKHWPGFVWDHEKIGPVLAAVRHQQGRLLGRMEGMALQYQAGAHLDMLCLETLRSAEMDGLVLDPEGVRFLVARGLGMETGSPGTSGTEDAAEDGAGDGAEDPVIEGMVGMVLDATQNYMAPLTNERLLGWDAALMPVGYSGDEAVVGYRGAISAGELRGAAGEATGGAIGRAAGGADGGATDRKKVHFQAPDTERLEQEMAKLLRWFNRIGPLDPVIKAGIVHLLFVTIHPFPETNGRIARAVTEMQLARADQGARRYYSLSARIGEERNAYHKILERTARSSPDITEWLEWFVACLGHAIADAQGALAGVAQKSRFWEGHVSASINSRQKRMLNLLLEGFEGPLTSSLWARMANCSQDTAGRDINELVRSGILVKGVAGGRSTSYVLVE